jgi:nitrogen fixation NifU-like protein
VTNTPANPAESASSFYHETILHHSRQPIGFNKPISWTHEHEQFNPLCGDHIRLMLEINGETVVDAAFEGESCAICKASASMLCELAPGQTGQALLERRQWLESALAGDEQPIDDQPMCALLRVRAYPSRVQCALLPWEALKEALSPNPRAR